LNDARRKSYVVFLPNIIYNGIRFVFTGMQDGRDDEYTVMKRR